jgi:hypothetical protein
VNSNQPIFALCLIHRFRPTNLVFMAIFLTLIHVCRRSYAQIHLPEPYYLLSHTYVVARYLSNTFRSDPVPCFRQSMHSFGPKAM